MTAKGIAKKELVSIYNNVAVQQVSHNAMEVPNEMYVMKSL